MDPQYSQWYSYKVRETDISLNVLTSALGAGNNDLVAARPSSARAKNRWNLYNLKTGRVAILNHAFVWSWGSPHYTGNFVPEGVQTPTGLPEGRIQRKPSYQCEISYAFNTSNDKSVYEGLAALEKYIETVPDFNQNKKPKSTWQSLENNDTNHRYIATASLFTRRNMDNAPVDGKFKVKYPLHPWIQQALDPDTTRLVPNKDRPLYFCMNGSELKRLEEASPREFRKDDVIWMSFYVSFNIRSSSWSVEITPLELVRVGHVLDSESDLQNDGPGLEFQSIENLVMGSAPGTTDKRKRVDSTSSHSSKSPRLGQNKEQDNEAMEVEEDVQVDEREKTGRTRRARGDMAKR